MITVPHLPTGLVLRLPRRAALALFGKSLTVILEPDALAGEVNIENKRWFCPDGDWDLSVRDIRRTPAFSVMRAAVAGPNSAEWKVCREQLLQATARPRRRTSAAFLLDSADNIDRYLKYCQALAQAVERGEARDAKNRACLALGRDGRFFKTTDGRHRFSAAILLGKPIRAQITHLHPELLRCKQRLSAVLGAHPDSTIS